MVLSRSDEKTEKMTILTTMGFDHQAAEASLKRCSSIEVRRTQEFEPVYRYVLDEVETMTHDDTTETPQKSTENSTESLTETGKSEHTRA